MVKPLIYSMASFFNNVIPSKQHLHFVSAVENNGVKWAFQCMHCISECPHTKGNDLDQPDEATVFSPSCLICFCIDFHEYIPFK